MANTAPKTGSFVLMLHSHLPYVLHHGRWPHGSDWLCEAALDSYLPLLETLRALAHDGIPAPVTASTARGEIHTSSAAAVAPAS